MVVGREWCKLVYNYLILYMYARTYIIYDKRVNSIENIVYAIDRMKIGL